MADSPPPRPPSRGAGRARRPQAPEGRRWWVGYAIAFVCAVLLVNAIAGERGYLELRRLQRHHAEATAALARRRAETAELKARIERLRTDPSAIEYAIREQLGYARPGEMVFPVREGSVSPGQAPTPVPNPPATAGRGH